VICNFSTLLATILNASSSLASILIPFFSGFEASISISSFSPTISSLLRYYCYGLLFSVSFPIAPLISIFIPVINVSSTLLNLINSEIVHRFSLLKCIWFVFPLILENVPKVGVEVAFCLTTSSLKLLFPQHIDVTEYLWGLRLRLAYFE
jgi:hypothetical protein